MRKTVDAVLLALGAISTILSFAEMFDRYRSIFYVLIGIAIYHFISKRPECDDVSMQPYSRSSAKAFHIVLLVAAPIVVLFALVAGLKWLDLMTTDLLHGIMFASAFFLPIVYAIEFSVFFSTTTNGD